MSDDEIMSRFPGCTNVLTISDIYEPNVVEVLDSVFYAENKDGFERTRALFHDEISQNTFDAFIKSKTMHRNDDLLPFVVPTQYFFDSSPWIYSDEDVLVDCGAFDGDSIRDFISLRGNKYSEIIALEPDKKNYERLRSWISESGMANISAINAGVYKEKAVLTFHSSGDMEAYLSEDGDVSIPVESIDDICADKKVSIIKMDIEGSEKDALIGGAKTIKKYEPILMISAYHKKDDLITLVEQIGKLSQNYVYFLRAHKPLPIDVVLYAIPKDKVLI